MLRQAATLIPQTVQDITTEQASQIEVTLQTTMLRALMDIRFATLTAVGADPSQPVGAYSILELPTSKLP